jgi:DNA segregation ATPase FtsK/SpoIIIE-like protein
MTVNRAYRDKVRAEMARTGAPYNVARRVVDARFQAAEATASLPTFLEYPGPTDRWNHVLLGASVDGPVVWDVKQDAHAMISGLTGSGKSVLQRLILNHALAHNKAWQIIAVDLKRVELSWLAPYSNVTVVATELESAVEALEQAAAETRRRLALCAAEGVNYFTLLAEVLPAVLVMVDETYPLFAIEQRPRGESATEDALRDRAYEAAKYLVERGRAVGMHAVMGSQRISHEGMPGVVRANCMMRIAAGRAYNEVASLMALDDEAAAHLPKIKGRGMVRDGSNHEPREFQFFYAAPDWIDGFLTGDRP